jgi:NAD(P)-dependent dehydrogenase (short-subunit alcohol dehydrogenase family)
MSLSNHSGINFRGLVYLVDVGDHDQAGPGPAFHEQVAGQSQFGVVVYVAATLASMDLGTPLKSGVQNLTINSPVLIAAYGSLVGSGAVNVQDAAVGEYMADALTQITNLNPSGCIAFVSGFSLKTSYDTGSADSKFRQFVDKLDSFGGGIRDIANMVVFLASHLSSYVTGQILSVDGGFTAHLPSVADMRPIIDSMKKAPGQWS